MKPTLYVGLSVNTDTFDGTAATNPFRVVSRSYYKANDPHVMSAGCNIIGTLAVGNIEIRALVHKDTELPEMDGVTLLNTLGSTLAYEYTVLPEGALGNGVVLGPQEDAALHFQYPACDVRLDVSH